MNDKKNKLNPLMITGISIIIFFMLLIPLQWNILVSAMISIGTYVGISLITTEQVKIGSTPIDMLAQGQEMKDTLDTAHLKIIKIGQISKQINDPEIKQMSQQLYQTGLDIIDYLNKKPENISKSLFFLNSHVDTALRILDNYQTLIKSTTKGKHKKIEESAEKGLRILVKIFEDQKDGYHKSAIALMEAESDTLMTALEMGELEKLENNITTDTDNAFPIEEKQKAILKQTDDLIEDLMKTKKEIDEKNKSLEANGEYKKE